MECLRNPPPGFSSYTSILSCIRCIGASNVKCTTCEPIHGLLDLSLVIIRTKGVHEVVM
ncbi:hypothetical protein CPB84DRAFT_1798068 [Gymnopilus junonius]|uniref:Uncharacterized protein n=1 Tax=Gymnopilus junonius TaxID=109634 RepID=A0A9P5TH16_GYMJU|nr:hypothetical protein CPB84DRAFT_1798068 [Gymnopilus junonius]